ncbi:MAG: hypothetical protein NVS3B7_03630 [Candidatus Elarobacter sp.]
MGRETRRRTQALDVQHHEGDPVPRGVNALPAEAQRLVSRIDALLALAVALLTQGGSDEAAYSLRETERRYLPDTVRAYLDVPPALRDATAQSMLVEQLRLLERATAQRLTVLAQSAETALAANGAFLSERFGPVDALPEAAVVDPADAPPALLVRRVLDRLQETSGPGLDPIAILERTASRLAAAFPEVATVKRGGFFGKGPIEAIALDIPRRDDLLRYILARASHGGIEASVTRFLRGVRNKTLVVDLGQWTQGLIEDLTTYVERERSARETLNRLFRESR